uniref:uncharacterized protein LOC123454672 isoform X1 n=1 Tax=Jaculus jaculus TaxID=51337 RepID=UPI001E1B2DFA|nr:uncharacterized protein LOC123454672 isoform X1 [Jaculus jaculus]
MDPLFPWLDSEVQTRTSSLTCGSNPRPLRRQWSPRTQSTCGASGAQMPADLPEECGSPGSQVAHSDCCLTAEVTRCDASAACSAMRSPP